MRERLALVADDREWKGEDGRVETAAAVSLYRQSDAQEEMKVHVQTLAEDRTRKRRTTGEVEVKVFQPAETDLRCILLRR